MPQLFTVFVRAKEMTLRAIRTLANSPGEDWSSLSPAAITLLMPCTPWQPDAVPPGRADART